MEETNEKVERPQKSPYWVMDCKCGCPLAFGHTNDGKKIPLDLRAPVYAVMRETSDQSKMVVVRTQLAYVSHFATCRFAGEFSKK